MKLIYTLFLAICFNITNAQNVKLIAKKVNADLSDAVTLNDVVYFRANDGINGWELWRSDGTEQGTYMMLDLNKGTQFDSSNPTSFILFKDKFYFVAKPRDSKYTNFYVSDGTVTGTKVVFENTSVDIHYELNGELHLYYNTGIFKVNQTNSGLESVVQFKDYGTSKTFMTGTYNSKNYFFIYRDRNISNTYYLVKYDPKNKIFTDLKSFYSINVPDSRFFSESYYSKDNRYMSIDEKNIFFSANEGNYGTELWTSDGTPEGTKRVKDINVGGGSSYPSSIYSIGKYVVFTAYENFVSLTDNKSYIYVYNTENEILKILESTNGKPFQSFSRYSSYLLNKTKLYFGGEYYVDDPSKTSNTAIFHRSESNYFVWDSSNEKLTKSENHFPNTPAKGNRLFDLEYSYACGFNYVRAIDTITNKITLEYIIPSSSKETQGDYSDSRDLRNIRHVKDGLIGAYDSGYISNYPPAIYGIYFIQKCGHSIEMKSNTNSFDICNGNTLEASTELKNASGNISYDWSFGGSCKKLGDQGKISLNFQDNGFLFVLAKDNSGCISGDTRKINIIEGGFEAKISGDIGICKGQTKTLKAQTIGGQAPFTYQWYLNGALIANTNKDSLTITEGGDYSVGINDAIGCSYTTNGYSIKSLTPTNITINSSKSNNILEPGEKILLSVSFISGQTYQWYKNDMIISGETRNNLSVISPGTYKVEIKNGPCSAFSNIVNIETITALPLYTNLKVFPNPVITTISIQKSGPADVKIFNMSGVILKQFLNVESNTLDVSLLSAGTYIISVLEGDKTAYFKIIKQ